MYNITLNLTFSDHKLSEETIHTLLDRLEKADDIKKLTVQVSKRGLDIVKTVLTLAQICKKYSCDFQIDYFEGNSYSGVFISSQIIYINNEQQVIYG